MSDGLRIPEGPGRWFTDDELADLLRGARAEALREAADALEDHTDCADTCEDGDHLEFLAGPNWLRARADAVNSTDGGGL